MKSSGLGLAGVLLAVFIFIGLMFLGSFVAAVAYNISIADLFGLPKATVFHGLGVMVLANLFRQPINVKVNK